MDACAGRGANVAVDVMDGVRSIKGVDVSVTVDVGITGCAVTGNAVGTGPMGSITFLT